MERGCRWERLEEREGPEEKSPPKEKRWIHFESLPKGTGCHGLRWKLEIKMPHTPVSLVTGRARRGKGMSVKQLEKDAPRSTRDSAHVVADP